MHPWRKREDLRDADYFWHALPSSFGEMMWFPQTSISPTNPVQLYAWKIYITAGQRLTSAWGGVGLNMVVAHPVKMMLFQSAGFVLIIFGQASSLTASSVLVKFIIFHCVNIYFCCWFQYVPCQNSILPLYSLSEKKKKKKGKKSPSLNPQRGSFLWF